MNIPQTIEPLAIEQKSLNSQDPYFQNQSVKALMQLIS